MRCTNKFRISGLICLICAFAICISGCGTSLSESFNNPYPSYSYNSSLYENIDPDTDLDLDFFASDLCVTNTINFGTQETDSQVAQGAGAFNLTTNRVVYSQDIFKRLYPASTTKILTAYIIIKYGTLNDIVTVSKSAATQASDSSVCGLREGDNITVHDLLYGMMLESGNDAAEALAEYFSGSVETFAEFMTQEAHKLGATKSNFKNPSGLPNENHYTTVYDIYLIMREAIKLPKFVEIISSKTKQVTYSSKSGKLMDVTYSNNNRYLSGSQQPPNHFEIIGGKTGTTYDAGYCLVIYSKNNRGDDIISIVFKADGRHNLYLLMNQILSRFAFETSDSEVHD